MRKVVKLEIRNQKFEGGGLPEGRKGGNEGRRLWLKLHAVIPNFSLASLPLRPLRASVNHLKF